MSLHPTHTAVDIGEASASEREQVAQLYREAGYGAAIDPSDTVLVARSGDDVLAAVRLCSEHGVTVLRGMQVRSDCQRQGIGARLLAACRPRLDRGEAFCLPYTHLVAFYGAAGFEVADSAALPDFLAKRLAAYLDKGQAVLAMRRHGVRGG